MNLLFTHLLTIKKNRKLVFLSFCIFIIPLGNLYINNYQIISLIEFNQLALWCIGLFLIAILISITFKNNFEKLLMTLSLFWWLQYYELTHQLYFKLKNYFYYTSLELFTVKHELFSVLFAVYFILCFSFFAYLFFKFYNKYFHNFIIYFLIINLIFLVFEKVNIDSRSKQALQVTSFNPKFKEITSINKIENKKNIYFILMDEMPSASYAKLNFDIDYNDFLQKLISKNFNHYDNSLSFSSSTVNSLSHIFLLSEKENFKIFKAKFDPKNNLQFKDDLVITDAPALNALIQNNYKTFWFANGLLKCKEKFIKFFTSCISRDRNYVANFSVALVDFYSKKNLLLNPIIRRVINLNDNIAFTTQTELSLFKVFLKNNRHFINEKKTFFFVHNLSPHAPIRKANCEILFNGTNYKINEKLALSSSIKCALNQIVETVNLIKIIDPNSIVIIQGDHGMSYNSKNKKRSRQIFNFIDFGDKKKCQNSYINIRDNIEAVRSVFLCLNMIETF